MHFLFFAACASAQAQTSQPDLVAVGAEVKGIMDTDASIQAVVVRGGEDVGRKAIDAAKAALRDVESKMNSHDVDSELTSLNAGPVGVDIPLSAETLDVLRAARSYHKLTGGVFDVTCRPLLMLWWQAGRDGQLPTDEQIAKAKAKVGWEHFRLNEKSAARLADGATIDLGGIAKKHGIDRATEAMAKLGVAGGLVNVGGDVRCFGRRVGGGKWRVGVKNPFAKDEQFLGVIETAGGAVCTSGNYERFVTIEGKRYSHIVDPRTGRTADSVPSVTVVGPDAVSAGVWATALCVLGPAGLEKIPPEPKLEALLVTGEPDRFKLHMTRGMPELLKDLLPQAASPGRTTSPEK
ncbi:MAG: FAD:protein FMN transferase [Phycisphaerae bacterium]|nr:FAD:protein FMN transferase [Phycisphaerae bacterium]